MATGWYSTAFRKVLVANDTAPCFTNVAGNLDGEALARAYAAAHVQGLCITVKDGLGNCMYETKIGKQHPHLMKDYLGEFSAALKRHGLRVMAYFAPGPDQEAPLKHPEWQRLDENGKPRGGSPAGQMCLNSPYTDEVVIPQLQEITRLYDIDAFFLDGAFHQWFYEPPCFCPACRESFRRETGGDIPTRDDDPLAFQYRLWANARFEAIQCKLTRAVQEIRPHVMLCANFGYSVRYPVQPPGYVGFISMDPPTPSSYISSISGGSYAVHFSLEGRYLSTVGVPFDYMNTRMTSWGDWSLRPVGGLQLECALALANGARCFLSDRPYPDGSQEPAVIDAIGQTYAFVKEREPYCLDATPVPYIAILHSAASLWSKTPLRPWRLWNGGPGYDAVEGALKALVSSGLHCNILNSHGLLTNLSAYQVLLLPDQVCLSPQEAEAIRQFVRNGGGLVASYQTSFRDDTNQLLPRPALADLFGVEFQGLSPHTTGYVRPQGETLTGNFPDMPLLVEAPFTFVQPATAQALCPLVNPPEEALDAERAGSFWPGTPPPGQDSGHPALTLNRFGMGRVAYLSGELFGAYWRTDGVYLKHLIARCVDLVTPKGGKVIAIEAPPSVEVSLFQQGSNRIVHLVNYHAEKRDQGTPNIEYVPLLSGINVHLRSERRPKRVVQVPENLNLAWEVKDGVLSFTVPQLHLHACCVVQYEE